MLANYIDGKWTEQASGEIVNANPSDITDVIGVHPSADKHVTEAAIAGAQSATSTWSASNIQKRFDLLDAVGSQIIARSEELGTLLAREEGKTVREGIAEAVRAGQVFKFHAGQAVRMAGDILDSPRAGIDIQVRREAIGVVGIITPWNFPLAIPAWKIAPALAYGNCVVFKPASLVPGCAHALTEIIASAGCPPGVFNLVVGSGREVGETIVQSSGIDALSFTGSVETGMSIAQKAAGTMKRVQLEMGGKNPLIVLDDADLENAVECAIQGAFFSTGQRCTATSRIIVTPGIYSLFHDAFMEKARALVVGDALDRSTDIGPAVDQSQLETDLKYIDLGKMEGAVLSLGGELTQLPKKGFYISPTIFEDVSNDMRLAREEIFGPVVSLMRAAKYDEALAIANDTPFGLSAGICTTSLRYADDFRRNARAGLVMVNAPTAGVDYHVPFGGLKASSYGWREQGTAAIEFYTRQKTVYSNYSVAP